MVNQDNQPIMHQNREPIQMVEISNIREFLETEASEFELAEMEYKPGKNDAFSLYGKIASIMGDLDRIPKSGYNKQFDYKFVTESDVVGAVRPLMAKNKLVMIPSIRRYSVKDHKGRNSTMYIGTIEIKWTIIDGESGESVSFSMIGKGVDNMEKDIYKAITGNKKYALITLFMIDSGDDPENGHAGGDDHRPGNQQYNQNQYNQNQYNQHYQQQQRQPQYQAHPQQQQQRQQQTPPNRQNGAQGAPNHPNHTNTPGDMKNPPQAQESGKNDNIQQPAKSDLITRWMVLVGNSKPKAEARQEFDEWYLKKTDQGWDHMQMIQALTKRLHEKNQAEKEKLGKPADQAGTDQTTGKETAASKEDQKG